MRKSESETQRGLLSCSKTEAEGIQRAGRGDDKENVNS